SATRRPIFARRSPLLSAQAIHEVLSADKFFVRVPLLGRSRVDGGVVICACNATIETDSSVISACVPIAPSDCKHHMFAASCCGLQSPGILPFSNILSTKGIIFRIANYGHLRDGTIVVVYGPRCPKSAGYGGRGAGESNPECAET